MNWLAAGPQAIPTQQYPHAGSPEGRQEIFGQLLEAPASITNSAVERGPLAKGTFKIGGSQAEWNYYKCSDDRLVDLSAVYPTHHFVRAWAFAHLYSQVQESVQFLLTAFGPLEVWINKKSVFRSTESPDRPVTYTIEAPIKKGANRILINFAGLAAPGCVLAFALRVNSDSSQFQVRIPTLIPSLERRGELESAFDKVYLNREVFAWGDRIILNWPQDIEKQTYADARLQTPSGRIYSQAEDVGKPGQQITLGTAATLAEGPYQVFVTPLHWEYYESNIRVSKRLSLYGMGPNRFSSTPYGTPDERRDEALANAAARENHVYAEIAKVALGRWSRLESSAITQALAGISQNELGSAVALLGLLGAVARYGAQPEFPEWIGQHVREAAVNYPYWPDDASVNECRYAGQDDQLIRYTCEILAGQLYPEAFFSRSQRTGAQLRTEGEAGAARLMRSAGSNGFEDWDSRSVYANTLTALSYLIDLAETEEMWELGSVLMDKIFFSIALNSLNGVFGSTQGCTSTAEIKSGLLDPTSGITRLMWGMGVFNAHIAGTVSLACLKDYELPPIIAEVAAIPPAEVLNREQQGPVNKVTYRTPTFMLCSAQDYRPGQPGCREHIWQATLDPQAVVFTNHPGCSSENDAHVPGYWLGNGVLPRVAQWKDVLVALYRLPDDDRMGFTHAHFPTPEFDEYTLRGSTAFARKGEAYLALSALAGIELAETGHQAFRELRSYGKESAWICQMGQSSSDGSFTDFQETVLGRLPSFAGLDVRLQTLRGDELTFSWDGPLSINGSQEPLDGFKHYDNPYTSVDLPCTEMEIKTENYLLRLNFGSLSS